MIAERIVILHMFARTVLEIVRIWLKHCNAVCGALPRGLGSIVKTSVRLVRACFDCWRDVEAGRDLAVSGPRPAFDKIIKKDDYADSMDG